MGEGISIHNNRISLICEKIDTFISSHEYNFATALKIQILSWK